MQHIDTSHRTEGKGKFANRVLRQDKYDVVQIHMEKDEEITEHHAKEETLIIVRAGKVIFNVEGELVELTNESILQMEPMERHSLKATEETDLLLLKFK